MNLQIHSLICVLAILSLTFFVQAASANAKLKVNVQAGYLAAKECQRRVGGFGSELQTLRKRRSIAAKKFPPLLPEGSKNGRAGLVLLTARTQYMRFQQVPRRQWKDYCRRGLGKAIRRTRALR